MSQVLTRAICADAADQFLGNGHVIQITQRILEFREPVTVTLDRLARIDRAKELGRVT
jgi:hypothetical protein